MIIFVNKSNYQHAIRNPQTLLSTPVKTVQKSQVINGGQFK